jgi:predicted acylesterase/phospholipase RssA
MAKQVKRAITLAGGGPAAGLHIGVLKRLAQAGIEFDVWALSCIGAWVGLVYQQCDRGKEVEQTYEFFRDGVFRDDESYSRFPVNTVFGADNGANYRAAVDFLLSPDSYRNLLLPKEVTRAFGSTLEFMSNPAKWNEGDFNRWMLNDVMAVHPMSRFLTSLMYCTNVTGLSRIHWPDSSFMKAIRFDRLFDEDKPFIFHNAWNITKQRLDLFCNRPDFPSNIPDTFYGSITPASLCACSALPYVEETVEIGGDIYCEGALVDTVNFRNLIEDHDVDEIWICRIVDNKQVRPPRNIADALGTLCMLFAATVGEDDVTLFRYHAHHRGWKGTIVIIEVSDAVTIEWTRGNLDRGIAAGYQEADREVEKYRSGVRRPLLPEDEDNDDSTARARRRSKVVSPSVKEPATGARIA